MLAPPSLSAPSRARPDPAGLGATLRDLLHRGELDLPRPGRGATARRWSALAGFGRGDLSLARLIEGHTDAVAILAEAGRTPAPDAVYGVWAARSQAHMADGALHGTVRFCSGARLLDRALVVAAGSAGESPRVLVEAVLDPRYVHPDPGSWTVQAMAAADTLDVTFDGLPLATDARLGPPGWYTGRPGFAAGGGGVAAVWWGGAAALLDTAARSLPEGPDAHQLAHLGECDALLAAADALLDRTATRIDTPPRDGPDIVREVARVRSAVERAAREILDRVPRMLGPAPLSRDAALAGGLADLALYVRQHHGERDHSALGALVLDTMGRSSR